MSSVTDIGSITHWICQILPVIMLKSKSHFRSDGNRALFIALMVTAVLAMSWVLVWQGLSHDCYLTKCVWEDPVTTINSSEDLAQR